MKVADAVRYGGLCDRIHTRKDIRIHALRNRSICRSLELTGSIGYGSLLYRVDIELFTSFTAHVHPPTSLSNTSKSPAEGNSF